MEKPNFVFGKKETRSSSRATLNLEDASLQESSKPHPKLCEISKYPFSDVIAKDLNCLLKEKGTANTSAFEVIPTEEKTRQLTPSSLTPTQLADFFMSDFDKDVVGDWTIRMNEGIDNGNGEVFGPEFRYDVEGCKWGEVFNADMVAKIQEVGNSMKIDLFKITCQLVRGGFT